MRPDKCGRQPSSTDLPEVVSEADPNPVRRAGSRPRPAVIATTSRRTSRHRTSVRGASLTRHNQLCDPGPRRGCCWHTVWAARSDGLGGQRTRGRRRTTVQRTTESAAVGRGRDTDLRKDARHRATEGARNWLNAYWEARSSSDGSCTSSTQKASGGARSGSCRRTIHYRR